MLPMRRYSNSSLCYTILLWSISSGMPSVDAAFICEFDKCLGHVFPPFVILELLHLLLQVVLCKCLVGFEGIKCITFPFELHSSTVGGCIINEGHPIVISFPCSNWERAMQISEPAQVVELHVRQKMERDWSAFSQQGRVHKQCLVLWKNQRSYQSPNLPCASL